MVDHNVRAGDFNGLAANYQRFRIGYSSALYDVLQSFGFTAGRHVLDAGCGTGLAAVPLLERGLQVTGVDTAAQMLAAAKAEIPAATFAQASVEALPFGDATFDGAISAQAFHWFDGNRAFGELVRVVKPGGAVAVWWKLLGVDDPMRSRRAAACAQAGVAPTADALRGGFRSFYAAPFADRVLRVLPLRARFTPDEWIGYERSRAVARDTYGARFDRYLEALRANLLATHGSATARFEVRYTQYLYIGITAKR